MKSSSMPVPSQGRIHKGAAIPSDKGSMKPIHTTSEKMNGAATNDGTCKNLGKGHGK